MSGLLVDLEGHIAALDRLHRLTAQRFLHPGRSDITPDFVFRTIWNCSSTLQGAFLVTMAVLEYQQSSNQGMVGFRATTVRSFENDGFAWPVVEWTENDGTEVLTIFQFDNCWK